MNARHPLAHRHDSTCTSLRADASQSRATALSGLRYGQQRAALAPMTPSRPEGHPWSPIELDSPPIPLDTAGGLVLGPSVAWLAGVTTALQAPQDFGARPDVAARVAQAVSAHATTLRGHIVALLDASSVSRPGRAPDPTLPTRDDLHAWLGAATVFGSLARDPALALGGAIHVAARLAADAALAGFQALSVLAARRSWRTRAEEEQAPRLARSGRQRTEVDEVFKDAGFARRQVADSGVSVHDWCGLFASAALFRGGGLDEELRAGLYHTANVSDFFHYTQRANARRTPRSIWADGQWWTLRAYHERRGSVRSWLGRSELTRALHDGSGPDVRPGDVLLISHTGSAAPDHIVMVDGWDAETRTVTTLEGNTIGVKAAGDGPERTDGGDLKAGLYQRSGVGMHVRALEGPRRPRDRDRAAYRSRPAATLLGRGRQSAVDFEEHSFASRTVPEALRFTPPEQLSRRDQERIRMRAQK
ncbi:MAG: hypothetical protein IV100_08930 [Myxococcales bacterium]|nr:hypothetical protein [Myxococcales bacterium]